MQIVGRKKDIEELEKRYNSGEPEFVALYGRRRVGKTFLIKELFKDRITFWHTGIPPTEDGRIKAMENQLNAFYNSLLSYGLEGEPRPTNWIDAFFLLEKLIQKKDDGSRILIFIDELPWMDTARSNFIQAFEHFWNGWCFKRDNIMLVVCGSATSWIEDNVINNKGGLYNRLTCQIKIYPFTLNECEEYFKSKNISLGRYQIAELYMVFGGIPMYLSLIEKGLSVAQIIDQMIFDKKAKLNKEFERLFGSLFINPENYIEVVKFLSGRRSGYSRTEIIKGTGMKSGMGLSKMLLALEESDFITSYKPWGVTRNVLYKLTDPFCIAWLNFVEGKNPSPNFWQSNYGHSTLTAWRGLAFESLCFNHIPQIKNALRILGTYSEEQAMIIYGEGNKAEYQIDMLINRNDNVVNLCEMKFIGEEFKISEKYGMQLIQRITALNSKLKGKKYASLTFITTYGVENNGMVQNSITLDDLFRAIS